MGNIGDTLSFGIAILIMTLVIPYTALNTLIDSDSIPGTVLLGRQEFIHGFQLVALVLASVNVIAIIPGSLAKKISSTSHMITSSIDNDDSEDKKKKKS